MSKVNVYLPDDLERDVRESGVPVSAVCQAALRAVVDGMTAIRNADDLASLARVGVTPRLAQILATGPASALDLLGAIVLHGENLGARVLADLGVELPRPRGRKKGGRSTSRTPAAPEVRTAVSDAYRVALEMGHNYIGAEHVVIALAKPGSPAGPVFAALGIDDRSVQARVQRRLENPWRTDAAAETADPPAPEVLARFEAELRRMAIELRALQEGFRPSGG